AARPHALFTAAGHQGKQVVTRCRQIRERIAPRTNESPLPSRWKRVRAFSSRDAYAAGDLFEVAGVLPGSGRFTNRPFGRHCSSTPDFVPAYALGRNCLPPREHRLALFGERCSRLGGVLSMGADIELGGLV